MLGHAGGQNAEQTPSRFGQGVSQVTMSIRRQALRRLQGESANQYSQQHLRAPPRVGDGEDEAKGEKRDRALELSVVGQDGTVADGT